MDPAFPTKWHFIWGTVLVGVNRADGTFSGSADAQGHSVVAVWTSEAAAREALGGPFDLNSIEVSRLLTMLPAGIGLSVDPGSDRSLTVDPSYAESLRSLATPFPVGSVCTFKEWIDFPEACLDALRQTMTDDTVSSVRVMLYTVDDSPYFGCIAYETSHDAVSRTAAQSAIASALDHGATLSKLDVVTVQIVALDDLPENARRALPEGTHVRG